MKKTILSAFLLSAAQLAHAQSIPAGTISLGGSVGYSRSTSKTSGTSGNNTSSTETNSSQFNISPSVGYFVLDNLQVGLNLGYSSVRQPYTTSSLPYYSLPEPGPQTRLSVGPFVQYYKMVSEQFGFTGNLGAGYQREHYQTYYGGNSTSPDLLEINGSGFYAGLTPGIVFFPIPRLGLNASMGALAYNHSNYKYPTGVNVVGPVDYTNTTSYFGANFGLSQLQFGGTYYFGR
ncbi:hypothetical protein GCM10022409_25710 [Hymenobacter glaciei]|uniref:Outer membrane protein beta-barrel domain-containing protein n=1 Tax=Hymenobacter glaciei TaxID=877209 RepID=A0ABP7UCK1_9BACT